MKKQDVLMVGVGGQGIVLSSDILGEAALAAGYDVKKTDTLGMAQRGGSVISHVRIADHVWSPYGDYIYFYKSSSTTIWNVNVNDPSEQTIIIDSSINGLDPIISPTGRRIAFTTLEFTPGNFNLCTTNYDGTGIKLVTRTMQQIDEFRWSANGAKILFSGFVDAQYNIYIVNADGTGLLNLTNTLNDSYTLCDWNMR